MHTKAIQEVSSSESSDNEVPVMKRRRSTPVNDTSSPEFDNVSPIKEKSSIPQVQSPPGSGIASYIYSSNSWELALI